MGTPLKIDLRLDESFPHLRHAPITEAVVEVRVRAERRWDETEVSNKLKPKLPEYGAARSERGFEQAITMMPGQPAHQSVSDLGWRGLQFRSADGKNVPGFYRDSLRWSPKTGQDGSLSPNPKHDPPNVQETTTAQS